MGAGKTEVGRLLAKKLKMTYIDTDDIIEKRHKRSINDIFEKDGEEKFRDLESAVLNSIGELKDHVIATGGGIVLRPENVKKLKKLGPLVLLWAKPEVVYERTKGSSVRPLLNVDDPKEKIKEILAFRTPIYRNVADFQVDTSSLSPEDACNRIIAYIRGDK